MGNKHRIKVSTFKKKSLNKQGYISTTNLAFIEIV